MNLPEEGEARSVIRIDLAGKTRELWETLAPKFFEAIANVLATINEKAEEHGIYKHLEELASGGLQYLKDKLAKPGIDNSLVLAEVEERLANARLTHAEARNKELEADEREFKLQIKKLTKMLRLMRALLLADKSEPSIVLGEQLRCIIDSLEAEGAREVLDAPGVSES